MSRLSRNLEVRSWNVAALTHSGPEELSFLARQMKRIDLEVTGLIAPWGCWWD